MLTRVLLGLSCLFLFFPDCLSAQENAGTVLTDELLFSDEVLKGDVLFIGGYHGVQNHHGEMATAKQDHDFTGFIPINGRSDSGYVIVNHEDIISDPILGDGGGMTVFTVYRQNGNGRWIVADHEEGKFRNVDFSEVGGTIENCGGFQTPWGTVLTGEEWMYHSNTEIYKEGTGITDTSPFVVKEFNGKIVNQPIEKYENYEWMVEVDVANAKAIRKCYNMGRYYHEGGTILPDGKTVFLADDITPGYFFKFVAHQAYDLSEGQLYVYRQGPEGIGGGWAEMPMDLESMIDARNVAAGLGGTMFARTEWVVYYNGKIYITETGKDDSEAFFQKDRDKGAVLAAHLNEIDARDGASDYRLHDYYGRILEMDVETNHVRVYLEGGAGEEHHLANPDGLAFTRINGNPIIMINEDLTGHSHGRVPPGYNQRINEIFCLDLSIKNPTVDDLQKLAVGPEGCETTGGRFTPDGSTYFVNVQHPKSQNRFPFNNSVTIAVRNVDQWIASRILGEDIIDEVETVATHKRNKEFIYKKKEAFMVFNSDGDLVLKGRSKRISLHGLARGKYQLFLEGKLQPLVIR